MPIVTIGNTAPITVDPDADPVNPPAEARRAVELPNGRKDNHTVTTFSLPDGIPLSDAIMTVRAAFLGFHSDEPPAFVTSDDEVLQLVLCREFGCPSEPPRSFKAKDLHAAEEFLGLSGDR